MCFAAGGGGLKSQNKGESKGDPRVIYMTMGFVGKNAVPG